MNHNLRTTARKKCAIPFLWPIAVLLLVATACRTVPPLASVDFSTPGWKVQQGQAVWKPSKEAPELAGDLIVATNSVNGRTIVQFTKTPLPLVVAQTTTNSWQIEIPVQKKFYSGHGHPPKRLGWFLVPKLLQGAPAPRDWEFKRDESGFEMKNAKTGQSINGFVEAAEH